MANGLQTATRKAQTIAALEREKEREKERQEKDLSLLGDVLEERCQDVALQ